MDKKASIYDIARELGISASTVSRALNGHKSISIATRSRIVETARAMEYQPNRMARNLKQGHTLTIGVVVPQLNRYFFSNAINGIEEMASLYGYNIIISQTLNEVSREIKAMQKLNSSVVDGLLVSVVGQYSDYNHFVESQNRGMPIVFFDRYPMDDRFKRVCMDDYEAARSAVAHLASIGKRKIFHLAGNQDVSIWKERTRGYRSMISELGLGPRPGWIFENTQNHESGIAAVEKMIREGNIPDAIFASSDHTALGAMDAFKNNGLRIPEDIAVVGYGNEIFAPFTSPAMSTIDQHSSEMGKEALSQLLKLMDGEEIQDEVIIKHSLIVRDSSSPNSK